jgi:hypothetical protein
MVGEELILGGGDPEAFELRAEIRKTRDKSQTFMNVS